MHIETKYDIGQEVYFTPFIDLFLGKIVGIDTFTSNTARYVRYSIMQKDEPREWGVTEEDIFPTLALAQAECERRNKKLNS
jgi:hypothetical protein